jgi:hypothetical protein
MAATIPMIRFRHRILFAWKLGASSTTLCSALSVPALHDIRSAHYIFTATFRSPFDVLIRLPARLPFRWVGLILRPELQLIKVTLSIFYVRGHRSNLYLGGSRFEFRNGTGP